MTNLKPRYYFKLTVAYINRFKAIMFFGIIIGALTFALMRFVIPLLLQNKTERIALTGRYHVDQLPEEIINMIGDGLTRQLEDGSVEPDLATNWSSPDKGKTWTFTIEEGTTWHDEKKLVTKDISYSFNDLEVEYSSDNTIVFKLQDAYSPFPVVVSRPFFKSGLLGTGEWKVDKLSVAGSFVSELNLENLDGHKKHYRFYPTIDRTKLAYKLGEVDKVSNLADPSPFDSWSTSEITPHTNEHQVVTLFFNFQDKFSGEKAVRQALTYAIDKNSLGTRAISPVSPSSWGYNPQVKDYLFDPERAKELIDELPEEFTNDIQIKLVSTPQLLETAEKIKTNWEAIGVKTQIQVSSIVPSEYQVFLATLDIPKDPDQYPLWHSTQTASNISHFANNRIDKLLEEGRVEMNFENRKKIYFDFQRFLLEELPAAFLYHPTYYTVTRK